MKKCLALLMIAALALSAATLAEAPAIPEKVKDLFTETWVGPGKCTAEIWVEEGASTFTINGFMKDESYYEFKDVPFDPAANALSCKDGVRYKAPNDLTILDTGITASFTLENELLNCEDSLDMLKGPFVRLAVSEDALTIAEKTKRFTRDDIDQAVAMVVSKVAEWGCTLQSIHYGGDDACNAENLKWLSDLNHKNYTACMQLLSDFHSPVEGGGAWDADSDYKNYEWWLAREDGGSWELITWGY